MDDFITRVMGMENEMVMDSEIGEDEFMDQSTGSGENSQDQNTVSVCVLNV